MQVVELYDVLMTYDNVTNW